MKNVATLLAATLVAPIILTTVQAQTTIKSTVTSAGDYNWQDTANWDGGTVPNSSLAQAAMNPASGTPSGSINFTNLDGVTVAGIVNNTNAPASPFGVSYTVGTASETVTINNTIGASSRGIVATVSNAGNLTINANLFLDDTNGVTISTTSSGPTTNILIINGAISGSSTIFKDGGQNVYLGGSNSFSGGITFSAGANRGAVVGINTNAFLNTSGNITFGAVSNHPQSIGSVAVGTTLITNTIDLSNGGGSNSAGFRTGGTGSIFEVAGTLTNATGTTSISVGRTVNPDGSNPTGGGTVRFSGTGYTVAKNVLFNANDANIFLEFSPASGVQTWSGGISGTSGDGRPVSKSGAGTTVLSGNNTYDRQTIVNGGTLLLNGTNQNATAVTFGYGYQQNGTNATGHWQVESGGILGGTGTLAGRTGSNNNVTNAIAVLVKSNGTLAPGAGTGSIGTLTIGTLTMSNPGMQRGLVMAPAAEFDFEVAGNGTASDTVAFWGYSSSETTLSLATNTNVVSPNIINVALVGAPAAGTYQRTIMTFFSDGGTTPVAHGLTNTNALSVNIADTNITSATINWAGIGGDSNSISLQYTVSGAAPSPYSNWLTNYPSLSNTNLTADPDGDSFDNFSEFAFDGDPTVGSPALLRASNSGTNTAFAFIARLDSLTNYVVLSTTNLSTGPWTTNNTVTVTNTSDQSGVLLTNDYVRRGFTVPVSGTQEFYRVKAVITP